MVYFCSYKHCNKSYLSRRNLNRHKLTHSKPFSCSFNTALCTKRFGSNWDLQMHERTHKKSKSEECIYCKQRFTDRSALKKHQRIHDQSNAMDIRPFVCRLCHKRFTRKETLSRHWKSHCSHQKTYACTHMDCDASFKYKYNRNKHVKKYHHL
eukprot:821472_1